MIYLFYTEDSQGNTEIHPCPDHFNYMDTFYQIEAEARLVPYDIHYHGGDALPAMRILALSTMNADLSQRINSIIQDCGLWLRRN